MMLPNKESADMGRIQEFLSTRPDGEFVIKHYAHAGLPWCMYLVDIDDMLNPGCLSLTSSATTFAEALAKLSKLVYEESLKTRE